MLQRLEDGTGIVQDQQIVPMAEITPQLMDLKFAEYETKHRELVDEAIKAQFDLLDAVETS